MPFNPFARMFSIGRPVADTPIRPPFPPQFPGPKYNEGDIIPSPNSPGVLPEENYTLREFRQKRMPPVPPGTNPAEFLKRDEIWREQYKYLYDKTFPTPHINPTPEKMRAPQIKNTGVPQGGAVPGSAPPIQQASIELLPGVHGTFMRDPTAGVMELHVGNMPIPFKDEGQMKDFLKTFMQPRGSMLASVRQGGQSGGNA